MRSAWPCSGQLDQQHGVGERQADPDDAEHRYGGGHRGALDSPPQDDEDEEDREGRHEGEHHLELIAEVGRGDEAGRGEHRYGRERTGDLAPCGRARRCRSPR